MLLLCNVTFKILLRTTSAILFVLLCASNSIAQLPDTVWTRIYDEELEEYSCRYFPAIASTPDTGYVVAGYSCDGIDSNNAIAFKCDSEGAIQWLRDIRAEHSDGFWDATMTSDGGIFLSGYGGQTSALIAMKMGQEGDSEWTVSPFPSSGGDRNFVLKTFDNRLAVAGQLTPTTDPYAGLMLLGNSGEVLSVHSYVHPFWPRLARIVGVCQSNDGGFVIATWIDRPGHPLRNGAYIIRTDADGDSLWTRTWPVGDDSIDYTPTAVCRADNGNYFIAVDAYDLHNGVTSSLLVKMNDQGDTLWTRQFHFPGLGVGGIDQMLTDPHGGILVSTTAADQIHGGTVALLFKIDFEGSVLWSGTVAGLRGPFCRALGLAIAADGGYYWLLSDQVYPRVVRMEADTTSDVAPEPLVPLPLIQLQQNYPNPFNSTTTISYSLPRTMHVMLRVYDLTGREVGTLVDSNEQVGEHQIQFDANALPSGVYFYQLQAGQFSETRKLLLIR